MATSRRTYNTTTTGRTSRMTTHTSARSYTVTNRSAGSTTPSADHVGLNTLILDPVPSTSKKGSWLLYVFDNPVGSFFKIASPSKTYTFTAVDDSTPLEPATASISTIGTQAASRITVVSAPNNGETFRIIDAEGKSTTFTFNTSSTSTTGTTIGISGRTTPADIATVIASCINSEAIKITAAASSSVVALTQDIFGTFGNTVTTQTGNTSGNASGYVLADFSGGTGLDRTLHGKTVSFEDASGTTYNSTVDAGTQASLSIKIASDSNIASSTLASGSITVSDYSNITVSTRATCTITVDSSNITAGDSITLKDSRGVSHTFFAESTVYDNSTQYQLDTSSSSDTAANLASVISSNISFSATASSNQVVVTQAIGGLSGNTAITIRDASGSAGLSVSGSTFSSGADGDKITLIDSSGNTFNLFADANITSGDNSTQALALVNPSAYGNNLAFKKGTSNADTAANIKTALEAVKSFTVSASSNVVSVVQTIRGTSGNTTISENSSGITVSNFSGATAGDTFVFTTRHSDAVTLRCGEDFFISSSNRRFTRDSLMLAINNNSILQANFLAVRDDCENGTVSLIALRGGTADNSNTVSFSSSTVAASDISIQSVSNSASSGISAQSFSGGAAAAATSATIVDASTASTPSLLASEINSSLSLAITSGLGVTSSVSSNVVSLTMTTAGSVGNKELSGTLVSTRRAVASGFSGGADNVHIGSSKADYAANLAARINSTLGTFVTASVGASVTMTSARHQPTGKVTFATTNLGSYNSQTITITGIDRTRTYQFSEDCGETGRLDGDNVMVYLGNVSNVGAVTLDALAAEFTRALNHFNGHAFNIRPQTTSTSGQIKLFLRRGTDKTITSMSKSMTDSVLYKEDISQLVGMPITITMREAGDFRETYPAQVGMDDSLFLDKTSSEDPATAEGNVDSNYRTGPIGGEDASIIDYDNTRGGGNDSTGDYLNPNYQDFYGSDSTANSNTLLNDILVNRNGIYEHPTFRQYGDFPPYVLDPNYHGYTPPKGGYGDEGDTDTASLGPFPGDGEGLVPIEIIDETGYELEAIPIFRRDNTPHLQAKSIQYYYEPALENRHRPLVYSFAADQGNVALTGRQTLFNETHFFTNKTVNKIYNLKDSDARDTERGSLRKSHVIDLFRAARQASAANFKLRERIFPKEINSGRKGLLKRPDYHEVEYVFDLASDVKHEPPSIVDPSKKLTLVRNFWRNEQKDRIRNIRKKVDGTDEYVTPTGSIGITYAAAPLTLDGQQQEIRQFSHGFYVPMVSQKGAFMANEVKQKQHIAAGISTTYQHGRHPTALANFAPADGSDYLGGGGAGSKGKLSVNEDQVIPTQITSSQISTKVMATSYLKGLGLSVRPEDGPVVAFTIIDETKSAADGTKTSNLVTVGQELHWHQPFDFSLISVWPLDFPEYLWHVPVEIKGIPSSDSDWQNNVAAIEPIFKEIVGLDLSNSHDGPFVRGVQRVGLAPNRIAPRGMAVDPYEFMKTNPGELNKYFQEPNANQPNGPSSGLDPALQVSGAAGELVFSTKPTITLYNKHSYRRPLPFPSNALLPGGKTFFTLPATDAPFGTPVEYNTRKNVFNGAEFSEPIIRKVKLDGTIDGDHDPVPAGLVPELSTPINGSNETSRGSYEPKAPKARFDPSFNAFGAGGAEDDTGSIGAFGQAYLDYESIHHTTFLRNGANTLFQPLPELTGSFNIYNFDKKKEEYFFLERSAETVSGYSTATASMQFLRHAWPYYQPIWRLDKLTGRTPFHDSYSEFIKDVDLIGRDYSQISEFTISNRFKEYENVIAASKANNMPLYSITPFKRIKRNFYKEVEYVANFASIVGVSSVINNYKKYEGSVIKPFPGQDNQASSSAYSTTFASRSTMHDLEYADYTVVLNSLKADEVASSDGHWRMDPQSSKFMPKYMQTNACDNFSKLIRQNGQGLAADKNTVPFKVRLSVKAIKKLLPQKDFYPIFRTVNIGSQLIEAYSDFLHYSTAEYFGINSGVTDSHKGAAATQSFLEPLFAPGIMFNSIKSGLGVSYPLFLDKAPYYYGNPHIHGPFGPSPFVSPGNLNSGYDNLSYRIDDPKTMFSYGLANSAGVNRTSPTYLMRSPSHQLPFEAIYNPEIIVNAFSNNKSYMVDDLFDQSRSMYVTGTYTQSEHESGSPGPSHEWTFATASIAYAITGTAIHSHMTGTRFVISARLPRSGEVFDSIFSGGDGETYGIHEYAGTAAEHHRRGANNPSFAIWPEINNRTYAVGDKKIWSNPGDATGPEFGPSTEVWEFEGVANNTDPATLTGSQFLIGTNEYEYAANLAAAINRRCHVTASYDADSISSDGVYDIDGNKIPKTDHILTSSVHQFFTASVIQDSSAKYGQHPNKTATILKIHSAGPFMAHGIEEAPLIFVGNQSVEYGETNISPWVSTIEKRLPAAGGVLDGTEHSVFGAPITNLPLRGTKFTFNANDPFTKYYHSWGYMDRKGGSYPRNIAQHEFKPHVKLAPKASNSDPTYEELLYNSSINNFLAETVNFFLQPITSGRYYDLKLPVMVSDPKSLISVDKGTTYYMSVNLYMGQSHVMCEGPRFANVPHVVQNASSSMRGAFFGPPMEVVHRDEYLNGPASGGYATEEEAMSANLTDPAYHHVTPPYFYGPSSILLKYVAETDGAVTIDEIWSSTKKDSLYFEEYSTGIDDFTGNTIGNSVPVSDLQFPTSSLSPKLPTKKSISQGSAARMKLEECVDVWSEAGLIEVSPIDQDSPQNNLNQTSKVWAIMPKWMCPVLDFGLPGTIRTSTEKVRPGGYKQLSSSFLSTTSYYNMLTGRSMWLGYGYNPYSIKEKKAMENFLLKQKAKHDLFQNAYKESLMEEPVNGKIEDINVAFVVEPDQTHLDLDKKGIYLQISETFPEEMVSQAPSAVVFQSPYEGSEDESGYYTSREQYFSSSASPVTESLAKKLGFSTQGRNNIGQIAHSKVISEAVVVIPYLEKPFSILSKLQREGAANPRLGNLIEHPDATPRETRMRLLMGTKQIIPGYHFLAIDNLLFDNFLNTILIDHLTHAKSRTRVDLITRYKDYSNSLTAAEQSDLGRMINTLLGRSTGAKLGYMLPPELDFINNAAVSPFQMAIVPFEESFQDHDLKHIWQNLAPDQSHIAEKAMREVVFNPTSNSCHTADQKADLVNFNPDGDNFKAPGMYLTAPGSFLNTFVLSSGVQDQLADSLVYRNSENIPADSAEFFEKLKWLTFKVKARGAQDYESFKKRQMDVALGANGYQRGQQGDLQYTGLDCLGTREIYGANWPYDFFSLIERAKIEIEYEVSG